MRKKSQQGFSIVEVLFSVFVFSIGLLGVAGMQLMTQQSDFEARQRTQAAFLANSMIEKMRINASALADYHNSVVGDGAVPTPAVDCLTSDCSPTQLSDYDLWSWEQFLDGHAEQQGDDLVGGLVAPTGCIVVNDNRVTVTVAWRGQQTIAADEQVQCGLNSARYAGHNGENNDYRRTLTMNAFIQST